MPLRSWALGSVTLRSWALGLLLLVASSGLALADTASALKAYRAGDYKTALKDFKGLAGKGEAEAQYWLGHMYAQGTGVKKNIPTAVTWISKAADQGLVIAQRELGLIYIKGEGVLQDYTKAASLLQAAAHQNDAIAQRALGQLYAQGLGLKQDPVWAYVWYDYAVKNGDKQAPDLRAALAKTMTSDQITQAEQLAQEIKGEVFGQGS